MKFNKLTIIKFDHEEKRLVGRGSRVFVLCQCDCGKQKVINYESIIRGLSKSCGCTNIENPPNKKHGLDGCCLNNIWYCMKSRCYNKNHFEFKYWGGKGVSVCDEWRNDFISFYNWAMSHGYSDELSIDRIDGNGNYCPDNCRWATPLEQVLNRSVPRS